MKKCAATKHNNDLLLASLSKFYDDKDRVQLVSPIINGESRISLRLIDWFVTNYCKKHGVVITCATDDSVSHFNVYLSYRSQLKAYSKQQFDPFRRRERLEFHFNDEVVIETTIGQLNFFRWVLQYELVPYIEENFQNIESDMINSQKENQQKRQCTDNIKVKVVRSATGETILQHRKKRNELSKSFVHHMNKFMGRTTIKFD